MEGASQPVEGFRDGAVGAGEQLVDLLAGDALEADVVALAGTPPRRLVAAPRYRWPRSPSCSRCTGRVSRRRPAG